MTKLQIFFKTILNNLFASLPLSIFLMLIYAAVIGWATFVEKENGTLVAHDVIYRSWWFESLNVWILINILCCMYKNAKFGFKVCVHTFHIAFVIMIIGAGITRYYGFEGRMTLKDGETSSFFTSNDYYLNVFISNDVGANGDEKDIIALESFRKSYPISLSPYVRYSSFDMKTDEPFNKKLHIHSLSIINYSLSSLFAQAKNENRQVSTQELQEKRTENHYVAKFEIEYDGQTQIMVVSNRSEMQVARFGNRYITLSWGPKVMQLPFALTLDKFEVLTYPGSKMESSYASYVRVLDEGHEDYEYKIYMNNVLDYKGYRFFQSEYNVARGEDGEAMRDENGMPVYTGTILSVNYDPGKIPTYIGYTLMILGALWLLVDKDSRFVHLSRFLKGRKMLLFFFACFLSSSSLMQSVHAENLQANNIAENLQENSTAENPQENSMKEENNQHHDSLNNADIASKRTQERYESAARLFFGHIKNFVSRADQTTTALKDTSSSAIEKRLNGLKNIPEQTLKNFAKLQIQGNDGRIKLIDTYSDEVMRKITGTSNFKDLGHNQFLLGLMVLPEDMAKLRLIQVKNKEILKLLGIEQGNHVSIEDLFYPDKIQSIYKFTKTQTKETFEAFQDAYKLRSFVDIALEKRDSERNEFDKQILRLHEKMDFLLPFSVWSYMQILPFWDDETWKAFGNPNLLDPKFNFLIYLYYDFVTEARMGIIFNEWENFNESLLHFSRLQELEGRSSFLNTTRIESELLLNQLNIFPVSQYVYLFLGSLLFFIALIAIVSNKKIPKWLGLSFYILLFFVFIMHTAGLLLRWYIGGHAPWSNAYESMLYIAWASAFAGVIVLRKSYFALCGSSFLAGMALMVAHWGFMDPQIGNLQPVLQSYWLNIHVAVIVASYGFLGLSLMLGITNLLLFGFRNQQRPQIDNSIISLTALSEMSMIIGILMLTAGTFLGGVWANESWGRYWSWDSKETWSLVSIGVYACVLHIRLLRPLTFCYIFNALSLLAFYSILMTYFGVNYYLGTGLHSYAQGEGNSVNNLVYVSLGASTLLLLLAFPKRKLFMPKDFY